jgi:hypothetical protein
MFDHLVDFRRIAIAALLGLSLSLTACGGGSSGPDNPGTGTVALLLTDLPTDDLREINFDVVEATLIGDQGQQNVFTGNTRVNLLDLENYSVPIALGQVTAGTYTKLRLQIANFEIVDNLGEKHYPRPPANGRIDLLEPGGIEVVPGRMLVAHVDMDANRSIHVVQTGNGKYRVRPVVRVEFKLDGLPNELVRIEGRIASVADGEPGNFVLCSLDNPDVCLDVSLAEGACIFDEDGIPFEIIDENTLAVDDMVVVIGTYSAGDGDGNPDLDAIIVEKGLAEQVKGIVTEVPDADGLFLLIDRGGVQTTVELQPGCTKIFGADGEVLTPDALQVGQGVEIEGVTSGDPAALRAALIVLDADDELQALSGTIAEPIANPGFVLATTGGDICVELVEDGQVTVIMNGGSEMMEGSFTDIQAGRAADAYGALGTDGVDGCFQASEVVVTVPTS